MEQPHVVLEYRYAEAVAYAADVHALQTRKGTGIPYISHLLGVSSLVLEAGGDETQAIAALLHDAAEDHGGAKRLDDIRQRFGPQVADIVELCSDSLAEDPRQKAEYWPRKEHHLSRLEGADPYGLLVVMADKVHNLRAIITDLTRYGHRTLRRFNGYPREIQRYYERNLEIAVDKGIPATLTIPLRSALETLRQYVDGPLWDKTPPDEYDIVPESEWRQHPWLSRLRSVSDMDGESARVIFGAPAGVAEALSHVVLQYRNRDGEWQDAPFSDIDLWAYTEHDGGATAWYYPFDYHPYMALNPENDYPAPTWRALFPKGWTETWPH